MNFLQYDLHLFDLDGTLINTRIAYTDAQKKALEIAIPNLTENDFSKYSRLIYDLCRIYSSSNVDVYMNAFLECIPKNLYKNDTLSSLIDNLIMLIGIWSIIFSSLSES